MRQEDKAKDIEQRLLSQKTLDELIKIKMEEELKFELEKSKKIAKKNKITDISKVPTELIFSKQATYRIFNKTNKTESFLNGIQAESMLGMQNNIREKIKAGEMDAFSTENSYIKFDYIEVKGK